MNAKKKAKSMDPIQQAELILHLYELRRETVMREARSYVGGEFMPASAEDFIQIVSAGQAYRLCSAGLRILGHGRRICAKRRS
ncbi:MAG: hypothetical protein WAK33_24610 [Silvibacterium sp.]